MESCGRFGYAALACVHWVSASGLIGVDSIDVANRLRRPGVIYNAEMFESEPFITRRYAHDSAMTAMNSDTKNRKAQHSGE